MLRNDFLKYVGQTSPSPMLVEVSRAEGIYFYTPQGKRYYDLVAGVSVSNVGHGNSKVVDAIKKQVESYTHIMVYGELVERPQVEYAKRVVELMGDPFNSLYFVNSGAEAIEVALKLVRRHTSRQEIISMRQAYHGSTTGAMSLMGTEEHCDAFRPLMGATLQISYNNFEDLQLITTSTAAVFVEPLQGEAGVRLPQKGYLEALRRRCDDVGALLVFDEIQTGFGRTGRLFGFQKYGVIPDVVCLAKAFGGGMPLGGVVSKAEILNDFTFNPVLGHITTFGGHPVCCAAGLASLEYIVENDLCANAERIGERFELLLKSHPKVEEIRRSGALMAVELGSSERVMALMTRFKDAGVMSDWFLFCDTAFRISPPLVMSLEQVEECCKVILEQLDEPL